MTAASDTLRRAARTLRNGTSAFVAENVRRPLADWLEAEAVVQDMMPPITELMRATANTAVGDVTVTAAPAEDEIRVVGDSGVQAVALARAVLKET